MIRAIFVFAILLILIILICVIVTSLSRFLKKEMDRRQTLHEKRIKELSQSEEGQKILEEESKKNSERAKRLQLPLMIFSLLIDFGFIILGLVGIILCTKDLMTGEKFMQIIFQHRGFYFMSPILILSGLASFVRHQKEFFGR